MGRVGKPHGIRGWVTVAPSTDEPQVRFAAGSTLRIGDRSCVVSASRIEGSRVTVLLDGVSDRGQAEALRGMWLYALVEASDRPDDPDEFYDHQLEGLRVLVGDREVGIVSGVLHLPGHDVLEVRRQAGGTHLVPFVSQIVVDVDLAAGTAVVEPPEGLLDDAD